ncbi:hypothetical protein [Ornithinimicrobium cryptoxanthini]|uniref:Uncharacterized protein n=1 Tax=Ornithinimicrobium cryptoxanthini TaxID=2934161 RepID=A0ABY4YH02_9MICO|nr:hypothetical protein [Ornithinimicrobium cryptoxanthini]USQ75810.1 hypothetical protein NF557_14550 [Ornithinimicrobium cryptoxanthini]
MSQLDYLAAQSIAREREHNLQLSLRQDAADRARPVAPTARAHTPSWVHDALVHLHLAHATTH